MIKRFEGDTWPGVAISHYKDEPGTWVGVTRRVLFESGDSGFQTRVFEVAPGGYTSFERHQHEHCVVVLDGAGEVRLGDDWFEIGPHDAVHVHPNQPHQFRNTGGQPFRILCIVDSKRDAPILLSNDPAAEASLS